MKIHPDPAKSLIGGDWVFDDCPVLPVSPLATCFHEAGHAVTGLMFRLPVVTAELFDHVPAAECFGIVRIDGGVEAPNDFDPPDWVMQQAALNWATMYCAGRQAEMLFHGIPQQGLIDFMDPDTRSARNILFDFYGSSEPLYYCQERARHLVSKHWGAVDVLARLLLEQGKVDLREFVSTACPQNQAN